MKSVRIDVVQFTDMIESVMVALRRDYDASEARSLNEWFFEVGLLVMEHGGRPAAPVRRAAGRPHLRVVKGEGR